MKKSAYTVLVTIFAFVSLVSCEKELIYGDGPVITETRTASNFHGISSGVPGKVYFKIDPVFKVEVHAQRNVLDVLKTEVVNGMLWIDYRRRVEVRRAEDVVIYVTAPGADYFNISGVGDINVEGNVVANNLRLDISGAANITLEKATIADKIDARISGSGNIIINTGSALREELRISGSGSMELSNIPAERAEINISGSGDMKVNLSKYLDASISGSGSVYYKGNPSISTHISGSGNVRPL
jgi:hypothetical protein